MHPKSVARSARLLALCAALPAPMAMARAARPADPLIFACTTPQGRLLVRDAGAGRVTVVFPGPGSADLGGIASRPRASRHARTGYSGGGMEQLQVDTGTGRLTIYSRTIRTNFKAGEPNDPAFSSGAVFQARGRRTIRRDCRAAEGFRVDISRGRPTAEVIDIPD